MKSSRKNTARVPVQPSRDDMKAYWGGEWPIDKQVFCDDWMEKRSLTAARIFFSFNILYHVTVFVLVSLWLEPGDMMIAKAHMHHTVGLIYSAILILIFDRSFRKTGILYGATQIFLNAGSIIIATYEVIVGRPEMHVLQAYMVSTAVSFVSVISSPYSKPWGTGVIFFQNSAMIIAMSFFWPSAGLSVAMWYIFLTALGWILQTGIVEKSLKEAAREFESRKILAKLARVSLDQELRFAQYIEDSFLPPGKTEIGPYIIECLRQRDGQMGGHWYAIRSDGDGGVFAIMCETNDQGVHGALILHAVQSLWAEDLSNQTLDPEMWLQKANRALFVLGKTEIHEVEITLVHLHDFVLTYWGAGQTQVYLAPEPNNTFSEVRPLTLEVLSLGRTERVFPRAASVTLGSQDRVFFGNKNLSNQSQISTAKDLEKIQQDMQADRSVEGSVENGDSSRSLIVITRRQIKHRGSAVRPA
jgi:hypothetical protein